MTISYSYKKVNILRVYDEDESDMD